MTGLILVLATLVLWRPLQQECLAFFLVHSEAPSEEVLSETVEQARNPGALLARLWRTQRIPSREFVLGYLGRVTASKPELLRQFEAVVLEAAADPDVEVRQLAFSALERLRHPQLHPLALRQLPDADPAVRLIGLQGLRYCATSNDVATAMRFLKDPEPRVVVAAALVLRQVVSQDFGIKVTQAMAQFTCIDTNPPPVPDLSAIQRGVARWDTWWSTHQHEYAPDSSTSLLPATARSLPTPDFQLEDSAGKQVRLSQFRGKSVLLVFWSPGAPASLDDVPGLRTLQNRHCEHLAVLGVCIPAAPSCADEHGPSPSAESHQHARHHHCDPAEPKSPEEFRALAQQTAERLHIRFPMLVDPENSLGLRFKVEDRPTYLLIDAQGKVHRRFVGFRTEQALAAIVAASTGSDR